MPNLTIDLNTILTSVVLAGILWVLRSQSTQQTATAVAQQRTDAIDREIVELRARVVTAEAAVSEVSLRVAKMEGCRSGPH